MDAEHIIEELGTVGREAISHYFAVQGLLHGNWKTLFAPYITEEDARAMAARLKADNSACHYQVIEVQVLQVL